MSNGDNAPDIVMTHFAVLMSPYEYEIKEPAGVSVLLNQGDGTFPDNPIFSVGAASMTLFTLDDIDSNGTLDVVSGCSPCSGEPYVSVMMGNGDGTFQEETRFATIGSLNSLATVDWNEDGALDIVTANEGFIAILLGR